MKEMGLIYMSNARLKKQLVSLLRQ